MISNAAFVILASLVHNTFASPAARGANAPLCDVSSAVIETNGSTLPAPKFTPSFVGLGVGTQNYTCTSNGTYSNVGALAELFDISCLYGEPGFDELTSVTSLLWNAAPPALTPAEIISFGEKYDLSFVLGEHYFVVNPVTGSGLSPKWDFTSHAFAGNPNAYVVGSKVDDVPAVTGSSDIDWLYLTNLTGSLANEIYRIETRGGQPPSSCTPGSNNITVKYTSLYWFTGGEFS
ncbi:putative malate dehydrogenase [Lentinula raphanica]|nr:putative malate dehydrogenase [Lentinula raphanica]KAJ3973065.1 putative malate dehydrogenase [Lentinula raphanica]